jgi:hypothetical protein
VDRARSFSHNREVMVRRARLQGDFVDECQVLTQFEFSVANTGDELLFFMLPFNRSGCVHV